jgi:hypothetical protein
MSTSSTPIFSTTNRITFQDRWDHFTARMGWARTSRHRVEPGLYALGKPTPESPVFVTANYTLSFDALRSALKGMDAYILVLNTKGINVWCAAGKGSFGTYELARRIEQSKLAKVVSHRVLILPQLGAPGVSAHEVKNQTGFLVKYGPVRAEDIPEYMKSGEATPEMRQVRFDLSDRTALVWVELVGMILPALLAGVVFYFIGGWLGVAAVGTTVLLAPALFFIYFPWLPSRDFSTKGFFLGFILGLPFFVSILLANTGSFLLGLMKALPFLLGMSAVTGFICLNFSGSSPVASRTGVKREIFRYIPVMAWLTGISLVLWIATLVLKLIGVSHV